MRDLVFALAFASWAVTLPRWHRWFWPRFIVELCALMERPEPQPEPARLVVADLTVADTRWGRCDWIATKYDLVHPTGGAA